MKVIGLMTVRNEDWILGLTLRGVMLIVDEMIVLDHASTDDTALIIHEIAREHPGRIHYQCRKDPVWREATIRQSLLEDGRKLGGTHFWMIDADELATGNVLPQIRPMLATLEPGDLITIPWFPIWRSLDWRRQDSNDYWCANRTAYGFRDHPEIRYEARKNRPAYDMHTRAPVSPGQKREYWVNDPDRGAMHFVAAGRARLAAKTAWYKMIETVRFADRNAERLNDMYDPDLDETNLITVPVDPAWWTPYLSWREHVHLDRPSWYEWDCRRMWREYGPEKFAGLNLWGIPDRTAVALEDHSLV
ncbi:MAG: hypothetical protein WAO00_01070 [Chthoniobacterales bacterium]